MSSDWQGATAGRAESRRILRYFAPLSMTLNAKNS
jgi:hypothetical protein